MLAVTHIRQIPDDYSEAVGLGKYNRSRMPGCKDRFSAAQNVDGSFVTGLSQEEQESYTKILKQDLTDRSKFWETFEVVIDADRPKTFSSEKPFDVIGLKMLFANRYAAPTEKDANTPFYKDAQYYAYTEEGEVLEEVTSRKRRDQALSQLLQLSVSKDKLLLYGQYLEGIRYQPRLSEDTLYKMLRAYIEDKDIKNTNNFLEALDKPMETLQQKIIVDRALKARLVIKNGTKKGPIYQYGQVTLGTTLEDVYANLAKPEFAPELVAIQKDLDK